MAIFTKKTIWASTNNKQTVDFTFGNDRLTIAFNKKHSGLDSRMIILLKFRIDPVVKTAIKDAAIEIANHFKVSAVCETHIARQIRKMISDYI